MGQTASQASRQERQLRRQELAERVALFEERVREQLDWRAKLRSNRRRLIAGAAGAAALATATLLAKAWLAARRRPESPATLDDIAAELREIRRQLERRGRESPLWQRLVLRGAVAAASAGGAYAARRLTQGTGNEPRAGEAASAR